MEVNLYDQPLKLVKTYKYLGITFDEKLSYTPHLDAKINEAKRAIGKIWSYFSKLNGIKPKFCLLLWKTCIRPRLTYGCFLWAKVTRFKTYISRLNYIQRYALRTMGWFRRNMAGSILEVVSNCLPLPIYVDAISIMSLIRSRAHKIFTSEQMKTKQPKLIGHRQYLSERIKELGLEDYNLEEVVIDNMPKAYNFNKKYVVDSFNFDPKNPMAGFPQRSEDLSLFSDGSYLKYGQCGSGLAVYKIVKASFNDMRMQIPIFDRSRHLEENTIFIAEADGARTSATYILDNIDKPDFKHRSACCYIDSQACIKALDNSVITSKWVLEATKLLNRAAAALPEGLTIRWCKAHVTREVGTVFADGYTDTFDPNDRADRNAKLGASGSQDSIVDNHDLPGKTIATIKKHVFAKCHQFWNKECQKGEDSKYQICELKHFRKFWPKSTLQTQGK